MAITGAMMTFYKTVPQVVFWQWFNQSFNALVNYTNRNAQSPVSTNQLGLAYVSATSAALVTALGLKRVLEPRAGPFIQRFVPMMAVAAANCVNIPLMRQKELLEGVDLTTAEKPDEKLCQSKYAATKGIGQVVVSRNVMMAPGMFFLPFIMKSMEKRAWFMKRPALHAPFQVAGVGCFLLFMVPAACAIFPQNCEISVEKLKTSDSTAYQQLLKRVEGGQMPDKLYFNKGL